MTQDYHDIIDAKRPPLPHKHPPMSLSDRAAQFAPFSPLTGHSAALGEMEAHHVASLEEETLQLEDC